MSGDGYLKYVRELKSVADGCGIMCNQSHAPFPSHVDKWRESEKWFLRSLECTAEMGGDICVIHPDNNATPEENAEFYSKLLQRAKEFGVKIATENMWNWDLEENWALFAACATAESFKAHVDAAGDEFLVACVDIGHAEMMRDTASAADIIRALGDSVAALHIHDNDLRYDRHQIPFSMKIDFEKVAAALRDINYKGWFTLECNSYLKDFPEEKVLDGLLDLHEATVKFEKMVLGE